MKTILIADDDEQLLAAYSRALQHEGYDVITAQSGDAAITLARQRLPDLVLTDVQMPGTDGKTVLHNLRQDLEMSARPVILMTGHPEALHPRAGMNLGADDFLLKPITREELVRCVRARLQRAEIHWRVEERIIRELRSELATRLPHAFYTPLAGILGLVQVLRADFPHLRPEETEDLLADVERCGWRLQRTLRNYLLALELRDSPPRSPIPAEKVNECIRAGIEAAARRHGRVADISVGLVGCDLQGRPMDLSVATEELVDNACSFSRPGTPVAVTLNATGVLSVRDAGRGMTSQQIEQLTAFAALDRKNMSHESLGLGLALVQSIAASMGGSVSLLSTPGGGTTATVHFCGKDPLAHE